MNQSFCPSDSPQVTAEPVNRILTHMVVPQSPPVLPQYETNEPTMRPPKAKITALRASNQEIEDEM